MKHHTTWTPGDPLELPKFDMRSIAIQDLPMRDRYKILVSAIAPGPIALVSTVTRGGLPNLAPISFFDGVGTTPPALMLSIVPRNSGAKKDALRNIEETGACAARFGSSNARCTVRSRWAMVRSDQVRWWWERSCTRTWPTSASRMARSIFRSSRRSRASAE
jgi:hypothetical protein